MLVQILKIRKLKLTLCVCSKLYILTYIDSAPVNMYDHIYHLWAYWNFAYGRNVINSIFGWRGRFSSSFFVITLILFQTFWLLLLIFWKFSVNWVMVWDSNPRFDKGTSWQNFQTMWKRNFFKFKIRIYFVILDKYCQRLSLDDILLRLHIMTSQNNLFFACSVFYCHSISVSSTSFKISLVPSRKQ